MALANTLPGAKAWLEDTLKRRAVARKAQAKLPSYFAALRTTCGWFGVGVPEMERTLQLMREQDTCPRSFPTKLNRVMLNQAERSQGLWQEVLPTIAKRSIYNRIHYYNDKPIFGFAAQLTHQVVFELLHLYEKLLPRLRTDGITSQAILWVLVEEVFLPTLFVKLAKNWREGSGDEFQGSSCWYLPANDKGDRRYPISRVFQFWLQAVGFRNAHDLGKVLGDSARRKADRWLKGNGVPKIRELHAIVEKFGKEVRWSGRPDVWKTRFTLACAAHAMCFSMDSFFEATRRSSSMELSKMLTKIHEECIPMDDNREMADSWTFFAARLFHRRLIAEGRWESEVVAPAKAALAKTPPTDQSDEAMEQFYHERKWGMMEGNRLLESIKREVDAEGMNREMHTEEGGPQFRERILNWGAEELNRIIEGKAGERSARRP